jgi:hypothetical protein
MRVSHDGCGSGVVIAVAERAALGQFLPCAPLALVGAGRRMRTGLIFADPRWVSAREKATPFGKSGGAERLLVFAVLEVALCREVVVD